MGFEVGIVCGRCETHHRLGIAHCSACGSDLALAADVRASFRPVEAVSAAPTDEASVAPSEVPVAFERVPIHETSLEQTPFAPPVEPPTIGLRERQTLPETAAASVHDEPTVPAPIVANDPAKTQGMFAPKTQDALRRPKAEETQDVLSRATDKNFARPIPRVEPPSESRADIAKPADPVPARSMPAPATTARPAKSLAPSGGPERGLGAQLSESLRPRRQSPVPSRSPFPRQIREERLSPARPDPRSDSSSQLPLDGKRPPSDPRRAPERGQTGPRSFSPAAGLLLNDEARGPRTSSNASARAASPRTDVPFDALSLEEQMEQAKHFVCRSCSTPVPLVHKFCGRCGAVVPAEIVGARTKFFGALQTPGRAKVILIRGEGVEGLSYQLNADHHIIGRTGQLVFPDDPYVSPRHADLFYRDSELVVRDEGSVNGVYVRVRGTVPVSAGDHFLAGEQLFRLEPGPSTADVPGADGTYYYSSPKHQMPFRVSQVLQGEVPGIAVCARGTSLQVGREGGDLNFPSDLYMSASHCKIEEAGGKLSLTDLNSRNGTYLRITEERVLSHGDYLFIGKKLLRIEVTV